MKYTVPVHYNKDDDEYFIEFSDDMLKQVGWKANDTLNWKDNNDGSFTLTKKKTEWVMVDAISTFRQRYLVEVPEGETLWALDTVALEEAKEFSQEWLGETVVSHRVVTEDEAIKVFDADNKHCCDWPREQKIQNMLTTWEEQKKND